MDHLKRFVDAAFYTRNTPGWERVLRTLISASLIVPVVLGRVQPLVGGLLIASAVGLLATASTGFCPACYLAGRRMLARRDPR